VNTSDALSRPRPIWRLRTRLSPYFSRCGRCGFSWNVVAGHDTPYSTHSACFPLCEGCWRALMPEERLPFYLALMDQWEAGGEPDHNGTSWPQLRRDVALAVWDGK